jgi:urease subunit gamma/beta
MRLTPRELERLQLFSAAELARKRRARRVKLNYPEAVALICGMVRPWTRRCRWRPPSSVALT